jgi:cytochrome c553
MHRNIPWLLACLCAPLAASDLQAPLQPYRAAVNEDFSAQRGAQLWRQVRVVDGASRSCVSCHGDDPTQPGRHAGTGKTIAAMAPSVNGQRFSDPAKVEKWFRRNCKWTLGRVCTPLEKGDLLVWLQDL